MADDMNEVPTLKGLELVSRGKVRDLYKVDEKTLLIVATDRVSAYDVVLQGNIENKGKIITQTCAFWFKFFQRIPSHFITDNIDEMPEKVRLHKDSINNRCMLVKRLKILPVEAIVRGYITGSAWSEYEANGTISSVKYPSGINEAAKLEPCIFTPTTKESNSSGLHDRPLSESEYDELLGPDAEKVKALSIQIYQEAAKYVSLKGLIIADTKFEFGKDEEGNIYLADEVLTSDSTRYWAAQGYQAKGTRRCYDKQIIRDYLTEIGHDKKTPVPIRSDVSKALINQYTELYHKLTGSMSVL